ncbi:MAG: hypothetical protein AAF557_16950 [Pseudomonadota bacterium]
MLLRLRGVAVAVALSLLPMVGLAQEQRLGFEVDAKVIYMTREAPPSQSILSEFGFAPTPDLQNASSIDPGYEPGFRIRLHADVTQYFGVEASGTFLSKFSDSITSDNGLINAAEPAVAFAATSVDTEWESTFSAQQVNATYKIFEGVQGFAGLRRNAIDETLSMGFPGAPGVSISQRVDNRLVGPQIGLRVNARPLVGEAMGPFDIGLELAGGVLFSTISASGTGTGGIADTAIDSNETTYFAQAGIEAGFEIQPGFILSVGYQALWIGDILHVTEQFGTTNVLATATPTTLAQTDDILYHGGQLKLTLVID